MGLLEAINAMIPAEVEICGTTPEKIAEMVMLDVEFTPVLPDRIYSIDELHRDIPKPVRVVKDGLRYCLMFGKDYRWIDPQSLKVARARYLLVRGHYYKHFDSYPHSEQQEILWLYFKGGMWRPADDTELSKAMGLS